MKILFYVVENTKKPILILVDLPCGHNESFAAHAEDPAMGLCLGLSTSLSRHSSRRGSHSLHDQCLEAMANYPSPSGSCCHHRDDVFDPPMVPYPVYPTHSRLHTGARYVPLEEFGGKQDEK